MSTDETKNFNEHMAQFIEPRTHMCRVGACDNYGYEGDVCERRSSEYSSEPPRVGAKSTKETCTHGIHLAGREPHETCPYCRALRSVLERDALNGFQSSSEGRSNG